MATAGYYIADRAAQWAQAASWQSINGSTAPALGGMPRRRRRPRQRRQHDQALGRDGNNGPWTATVATRSPGPEPSNRSYVFYGQLHQLAQQRRHDHADAHQIMQQVATRHDQPARRADTVNVGLMRFSNNTSGGCEQQLRRGRHGAARGRARSRPKAALLSRTSRRLTCRRLYAAVRDRCTRPICYLSGGGRRLRHQFAQRGPESGGALPSVLSSREACAATRTPTRARCSSPARSNFIVLLTDGLPTADDSSNTAIQALIGGNCAVRPAKRAAASRRSPSTCTRTTCGLACRDPERDDLYGRLRPDGCQRLPPSTTAEYGRRRRRRVLRGEATPRRSRPCSPTSCARSWTTTPHSRRPRCRSTRSTARRT